jgi:hypothetical protein
LVSGSFDSKLGFFEAAMIALSLGSSGLARERELVCALLSVIVSGRSERGNPVIDF